MIVVSNVDYFNFVPSNPCVAVSWCKRGDMGASELYSAAYTDAASTAEYECCKACLT